MKKNVIICSLIVLYFSHAHTETCSTSYFSRLSQSNYATDKLIGHQFMSNKDSFSQRLSLPNNDWLQSRTGLSRTSSPIAFFHDGVSTSEIDLRFNLIGSQRRAQAIATAPRRKRYDDDDDEQKKTLLGYIKTPAVPIPTLDVAHQTQSLPPTQSGITFRINPPIREDSNELSYFYSHNRSSSGPLP